MRAFLIIFIAVFSGPATSRTETAFTSLPWSGQTFIHDPSTIVSDHGSYFIFGTGPGIRTKSSPDLSRWTAGEPVFRSAPAWITNAVPDFTGYVWAPDVIRLNGKFFLYYSASVWGKKTSVIGLATNPALDPTATNHLWTDGGEVLRSTKQTPFNAIDPSVMLDTDGKLWLAFGSYWQGIFLSELDPHTGHRFATNSPLFHLAWNHSIEAACLTRHQDYYYLFVNWGQCCQGTNSTYEVRVGRAAKITGPYLDREGKALTDGGGSPFLQSHGRFIGPGHIGILAAGDETRFSYHYYDAETQGRSRLALGRIDWTDGWPVAVK